MATYQNSRYNIALPSGSGGAITLIKTITASSDSTIDFVDGTSDVVLDNTYRTYIFKFINIHPATNDTIFSFNMSVDTGSNYNVTKTTTTHRAIHAEDNSDPDLEYDTGQDLAQSTGFQPLLRFIGNGNDECASGEMYLFDPSSTTFVKHFISCSSGHHQSDYNLSDFAAGYGNTTSAVDAVQFKMSSGAIESGVIKLYGIS